MEPVAYPLTDASSWARLVRPGLVERAALALRDRRLARRGAAMPKAVLTPAKGAIRALRPEEIVLLTVARNTRAYLSAFLDHHRRLGVTRFAVVDDRSDDGTREVLDGEPDVDRFVSAQTFREAGGSMAWRDAMVDFYGRERWVVSVDADEFLVYPGCEARPLRDFTADLERAGLTRALAPMLDLYPDGPLGAATFDPERHRHPTEVSPLIDGSGYTIAREKIGMAIRGGPRTRLFGGENRLSKFPVIYMDAATRFSGGTHHAPLPIRRNVAPVTAALLHFKFSAASLREFRTFAAEGAHFGGSLFYRMITEQSAFDEDLALNFEGSIPFTTSTDLVRRGFMLDLSAPRV